MQMYPDVVDGQAVWCLGADTEAEVAALERKAALLARLRHPGVVGRIEGSPGGAPRAARALPPQYVLRTRWVGADLTRLNRQLEPGEVAGLGAALANVVGDLHALGWVHGALCPEHVLLDQAGRPVLCGLGAARPADGPGDIADDRRALIDMLEGLLPRPAGSEWRRLWRVLRSSRRSGDVGALARRLSSASLGPFLPAGVAAVGSPGRAPHRGTPQPIESEAEGGPGSGGAGHGPSLAVPADDGVGGGERRSGRRLGRWRPESRAVLVAAGLAVVALASLFLMGPEHRRGCPPPDGNCRAVALPQGVLTTAAGRFAVGRAGDLIALGRWDCGPVALPALLRPSNGEVWVFDTWPTPGTDVAARPVGRVAGAASMAVSPGPGGCDLLRVLGSDGRSVILRAAPR